MVDFTFVTDRIATGAAINSKADVDELLAAGVTDVIDARLEFDDDPLMLRDQVPKPASTLKSLIALRCNYLWDGVADDGQHKPTNWFARALDFAMPALALPGRVVYSHCAQGVNRGPSLTYCILRAQGWPSNIALKLIRRRRPVTEEGIAYAADADAALKALGWTR